MVNGKRPWRADLKEAYDRVTERGLLPIYELTNSEPAESGRAPAWGVGVVGSNQTTRNETYQYFW